MARLQILELPEGTGDDRPPFVLVVDQYQPMRYVRGIDQDEPEVVDEFASTAEHIGARAVLVFAEPVEIPANDTVPVAVDHGEGDAQTGELIHAHEQTRLALCDALLLSRDTTWHKIIEQAGERQREVAHLYRARDRVRDLPERPQAMAVNPEHPYATWDGYAQGIRAAKRAIEDGG